jgi:SAM-dependent methyltransferase
VAGIDGQDAAVEPSARLRWIVDQLDLGRADAVLEVGCGHGLAGELVLDRLTTGRYVGIDRSQAMAAAAARRNGAAVAAGRARVVTTAIHLLDPGAERFDVAFAARVADAARPRELAVLAGLLRPGGRLVLAFDSPSAGRTAAVVREALAALPAAGFVGCEVLRADVDGHALAVVRGHRA